MSLSSVIIHGTLEQVQLLLEAGVPVNDIDEYGYTPLIQTAIMNNIEMAAAVLAHGAEVNGRDLSGGSALYWAVENNNVKLCQLLLKHGADVNAYTRAGEAIAVKPLLRRQFELRELLYQSGADFNFAQDFINAKLLAHRFELRGCVDIVNNKGYFVEIDLEGFFLEFTLDIIYRSLYDFHSNFLSKHLQNYLPAVQQLLEVLATARQLIKYEHYQINPSMYQQQIDALLAKPINLLPVSYEGHAITFIKCADILGKCDRSRNDTFSQNVMLYKLGKPAKFNAEFMCNLMYQRQSKQFIDERLPQLFDFHEMLELPIGTQITGNCSWANVEASVPVILFFALLLNNGNQHTDLEKHRKFAIFLYQQWREWDKDRALHYVINEFAKATPARKASIASLLAAVLFQRCSVENERDLARARKILPILRTPGYEYVLKSYIKVYCYHRPGPAGRNLQRLLNLIDEV